MQNYSDPLEQLRSSFNPHCQNKLKIHQQGKYIYFSNGIKLPMKTPTSWLSPFTNKYYSLGSLWLFLQYKQQGQSLYLENVTKNNMDYVNIADQDQIMRYFTGQIDISSSICHEALGVPTKKIKHQHIVKKQQIQVDNEIEIEEVNNSQNANLKLEESVLFQLEVMKHCSKHEVPSKTRSKCLKAPKLSFKKIIDDISLQQKQREINMKKEKGKSRIARFYELKKRPIIIVPETIEVGNISIHNIEKFLNEGVFDEKIRYENPHIAKTEFRHKLGNYNILFQVINNANLLKEQDWKYVIAIFTTGCESQFEKWNKNIYELLHNIKGFFLKYNGSVIKCSEKINAMQFILDRKLRYEDSQIVRLIWSQLQEYLFTKIP